MTTQPHHVDDAVTVWHGDCLTVLAAMPDNSVDAVVTDPPYGLEFMGKDWDSFGSTGRDDLRHRQRMASAPEPQKGNPWASERKSYGAVKKNPRCKRCGRLKWAESPCRCEQPDWDLRITESMHQYQQWCQSWATECLRVLKPGAHLLAFGGTRTSHRLASGIEDAGFEIRDSIVWLYGSGFPKSLDVGKAIDRAAGAEREIVGTERSPFRMADPLMGDSYMSTQTGDTRKVDADGYIIREVTAPATDDAKRWNGWGTALKPGHEPVVVARKPLSEGSVAGNVLRWGTGGLNIDAGRVGTDEDLSRTAGRNMFTRSYQVAAGYRPDGPPYAGRPETGHQTTGDPAGRWPPNVVLDPAAADQLDQQSGNIPAGDGRDWSAEKAHGTGDGATYLATKSTGQHYADSGGASRFFPVFRYEAKAPTHERPRVQRADGTWEAHATVKPLDLMRWLIRLVTPPGGTVLDPFAGSGTTGEAAIVEGFKAVLIEREPCGACGGHGCPDYLAMIMQRISKPIQPVLDFGA